MVMGRLDQHSPLNMAWRISVLFLIPLGIFIQVQRLFSEWNNNLPLVCAVKEMVHSRSHTAVKCINLDIRDMFSDSVATTQMLMIIEEIEGAEIINDQVLSHALDCNDDLYSGLSSKDPRLQLIFYYAQMKKAELTNGEIDIDNCIGALPSSKYLFYSYRIYNDSISSTYANKVLEMAYLRDTEWDDTYQRGIASFQVAKLRSERNDWKLAFEAYSRAIVSLANSEKPNRDLYIVRAYEGIGKIEQVRGNESAAREAYRSALLYSANYAIEAARAYAAMLGEDDFEFARYELLSLVFDHGKLDPELVSILMNGILENDLISLGEDLVNRALVEEPNSPDIRAARALLFRENGESEAAISSWREAISLVVDANFEKAAGWWTEVSKTYEDEANLTAAIEAQIEATLLISNDKWVWYRLARLYEKSGQILEARIAAYNALELGPGIEQIEGLVETLASESNDADGN